MRDIRMHQVDKHSDIFFFVFFLKYYINFNIVPVTDSENTIPKHLSPDVILALKGVRFIAQHIKDGDKNNEVNHSTSYFIFS